MNDKFAKSLDNKSRILSEKKDTDAVTSINYTSKLGEMLDSFARVMSAAIDARTPYNLNHTKNMVAYGKKFLDWLEKTESEFAFSEEKRRAFIMSIWLHDVGKIAIPSEIMDKESRLKDNGKAVFERFGIIKLLDRIAMLEGRIDEFEYKTRIANIERASVIIERADKAEFLSDEMLEEIAEISQYTYVDDENNICLWLSEYETECLSVRKGTLTAKERSIMESHVIMTSKLLTEMNFFDEYAMVPVLAAKHHELLNGKGYPNGILGDMIPWEVRLLTILDIFDALTAKDRPYKSPISIESAFDILWAMVKSNELDGDILKLFEISHAWEDDLFV